MNKLTESNFKRLVGVWKTSGIVKSDSGILELSGTDSYEWILDGNYLLHKAEVKMGTEKSETFEVIRPDNSFDKARMQYFNSKGEEGIMTATIMNDAFTIAGNGLKFSGTINTQNTIITGKWYRETKDGQWVEFIELKLEQTKK